MTQPLLFDTAEVGDTAGPFTYVIPEDFNRKRLAALGLQYGGAFALDREGHDHAEPSLLCGQHSWVMRRKYSWGGSVHAKCAVAYLKPVRLGSRIHVTGRISGKYERRGGRYVVFELQTTDDAGDTVCRVENTMLLNFREVVTARRQSGGHAQALPSSPTASASAVPAPSLALSFGPKPLRRDDILLFFQAEEDVYGPHPSIHNSASIAAAAGLPDIIAPGRYSIALMNCMFAKLYGARWIRGARYTVSFLQNLLPGIEARVHVDEVDGALPAEGTPRSFSVACRDGASGNTVMSGTVILRFE